MKGPESSNYDYPLKPQNPLLQRIMFGIEETSIRHYGLKPSQVDKWSTALIKGRLPKGFSSMEEFEQHVLAIIEGAKKK